MLTNFPSLYEMNNLMPNNEIKYSICLPEKHKILETDCISRCDLNLHWGKNSLPTEDHGENTPQETHCFIRFRKKKTTNTCIKGNNQRNRELWKIFTPISRWKNSFCFDSYRTQCIKWRAYHTKEYFPPLVIFAIYLKTIKYSLTCDVWELYLN